MTRAPKNLLAARKLLIDHLGPGVRTPAGVTILDPLGDPAWEVGIVGDANHVGGYHCGSDRLHRRNGVIADYSVVESPRDRDGLTLDAAALDVGMFKVRTPSGTYDLRHYSRWLVAQCEAGTADTRHLREVIYSPDGKVVRRWDRLGRRSTGDLSHLTHTHESWFRDAIKAGTDVSAVKRRYLIHIGVIKEAKNTMDDKQEAKLDRVLRMLEEMPKKVINGDFVPAARAPWNNADLPTNPHWRLGYAHQTTVEGVRAVLAGLGALRAEVGEALGRQPVDAQAIVVGVLAGLTPEAIAAAIPPAMARTVAEELARRLAASPKS